MDEEFATFFSQSWAEVQNNQSLQTKLLQCSLNLTNWAGNRFDQLGRKIKELIKELNDILNYRAIHHNLHRIRPLEREIEKLSDQEEMHWAQRSRVNWLKNGDINSKFFHSSASNRLRTNFINGLFNARGEWCEDDQSMADITLDYFHNLFASSNPSQYDIETIISTFDPVVDEQMNEMLCSPFTYDDIKRAVFYLHPSKAPGPDGFTALFFRNFGQLLGKP